MHTRCATLCFLLFFLDVALGQSTSTSDSFPPCATQCMNQAASNGACKSGDMPCMCRTATAEIANQVDSCITTLCTTADANQTRNSFEGICSRIPTAGSTFGNSASSSASSISSTSSLTSSSSTVPTSATLTTSTPRLTPVDLGVSLTNQPSKHHKSSGGAIAGAVIGVLVFLSLVAVGAYFYFRRRQHRHGGAGGRRRHFRKLSGGSSQIHGSNVPSPELLDYPSKTQMEGISVAKEISVENQRRSAIFEPNMPPRKPIPSYRGPMQLSSKIPLEDIVEDDGSFKGVLRSINRRLSNKQPPSWYDETRNVQTRPESSSTVSDLSSFAPTTPSINDTFRVSENFLHPSPFGSHNRARDSAPGNEVSRFSVSPMASLRNSTISQRLSQSLSNRFSSKSQVSVTSEDAFRTELSRMTMGYIPYPPNMPTSPQPIPSPPPIPQHFLDQMARTRNSSANPHRDSFAQTFGHMSIAQTFGGGNNNDEESGNARMRELTPSLRLSVPGQPPPSIYSDGASTPGGDGTFPSMVGSPVLHMASVQEPIPARARIVTVRSKNNLNGSDQSTREKKSNASSETISEVSEMSEDDRNP